jgi:hypothetical protein
MAHIKSSIHTISSSPTANLPRLSAPENWLITPFRGSLPSWTDCNLPVRTPINPWSATRETLQLLLHCWKAWGHCWRGRVILPHSCVIQVFIAVAWQQTRRGEAMPRDARLVTARLGSARKKHRFVNCCVIAGTCFGAAVLAWRKYATLLMI